VPASSATGIEIVVDSTFDDTLTGVNGVDVTLLGGKGNDVLSGSIGNDTVGEIWAGDLEDIDISGVTSITDFADQLQTDIGGSCPWDKGFSSRWVRRA
jgi:Ca2+-binding RTX toxin-like protein